MAANGPPLQVPFGVNPTPSTLTLASDPQPTLNPRLRKRTKTGCLTCRKRRIKCGEERPICGNCIKSKRHCEGYNQRVVFKTPLEGWPGMHGSASTIPFHTGALPGAQTAFQPPAPFLVEQTYSSPQDQQPQYGIPIDDHGRPIPFSPQPGVFTGQTLQFQLPQSFAVPVIPPQPNNFNSIPPTPESSHTLQSMASPTDQAFAQSQVSSLTTPVSASSQYQFVSSPNFDQGYFQGQEPPTPLSAIRPDLKPIKQEPSVPTPPATFSDAGDFQSGQLTATEYPWGQPGPAYSLENHGPGAFDTQTSGWTHPHTAFEQKPSISRDFSGAPLNLSSRWEPLAPVFSTQQIPASELLDEAAIEYEDDDYYDLQSDEDVEVLPGQAMIRMNERKDLGIILDLYRQHAGETSVRNYNTFIYEGILDQYRTEQVANPLKNPKTARVFAHFIFATAPSLSIFERQSRNSSAMFTESPVPNYQQGLWTYTLPMMALHHQGLLHAMLSLASLHIAKLQGAAITPSFKHYAYALKRIHQCVGRQNKRHLPTTLAATLLLGFYEVMTADHQKWCSHLMGASRLMMEIDYRGMARESRKLQEDQAAQEQFLGFDGSMSLQPNNHDFHHSLSVIDDELVSNLSGRYPRPVDSRHVAEDIMGDSSMRTEPFDMAKFQLYQDLFWWYARQDTYQSIIAGNRLLLDYRRWSDCPPRAGIGRIDAIYGTHDHLFLIFGRIADFSAKDRARKLRVMETHGGNWRPAPGMAMGPPGGQPSPSDGPPNGFPVGPSDQQPPPRGATGSTTPPTFYGMAPMPTNVHMPSSYAMNTSTPPNQSPTRSESTELDLPTATQLALVEWSEMYAALANLETHFGPGFQPLPADLLPTQSTPFGPPLMYPSYDIAVLWALYYSAHIVALRSHPHMPPAAMIAAGVGAGQTAHYANLIGRIASGMMPHTLAQPLNPSLGATLCEVTLALFFAGVQYREPQQRSWLVKRVRELEALTGWASVGMIAQGCETAWEKAWQAGRGPPYTRTAPQWHFGMRSAFGKPLEMSGLKDNEFQPEGESQRGRETNPGWRVQFAMGLLSGQDDVEAEKEAGTPTQL